MKKSIMLLAVLQLLYSCGIDTSKAETLNSNYGKENYSIENDTIFKDNVPIAIKVSTIQRFDNSRVMVIKAININDTVTYHEK